MLDCIYYTPKKAMPGIKNIKPGAIGGLASYRQELNIFTHKKSLYYQNLYYYYFSIGYSYPVSLPIEFLIFYLEILALYLNNIILQMFLSH